MKRFHVHVAVEDLDANIRFYSAVFGAPPTVTKTDYAKWMIEEPRINFAISSRGAKTGVDHLGFQVDSDEELGQLRQKVAEAEIAARSISRRPSAAMRVRINIGSLIRRASLGRLIAHSARSKSMASTR